MAEDSWQVKREGVGRSSSSYATQREAIQQARELARRAGGQLLIHGRNGQIREERTYPRGRDLYHRGAEGADRERSRGLPVSRA